MRRWLLLGTLCALGGGGLFYLDRHPLHLPFLDAEDPAAPGRDFFRPGPAPALLVTSLVARTEAARAGRFSRMDWSLAWVNLLEQELGSYGHRDVDALGPNPWAGREWVILTAGAARRLPPRERQSLGAFVAGGGVLLVVCPPPTYLSLTGVTLGEARERVARLRGEAAVLPPPAAAALRDLPFPVRLHALRGRAEDTAVLLRFDDAPALMVRRHGRGAVLTLLFELGRLLVTVQQGRPARDDYRLRKRWGKYPFVLETEDLVWHKAYLRSPVPAADVLERALVRAVRRVTPLPGWWAFPFDAAGLLLMTHDEDEYGSRACRLLLAEEERRGARATYFLIAGRRMADGWSAAAVGAFTRAGAHLALHWNRLPMITGIWKAEPFARVFSLKDQVGWFHARLRAAGLVPPPLINRNHYLAWASDRAFRRGEGHYTRTFRILYAHGVVLDSSYGPNRGGRGYLFGTGRPFLPLDVDGTVLPVWELPFQSQEDWGGVDAAWFAARLRESRELYHVAFTCIFHPHLVVRTPGGARLWRGVYDLAAAHAHPAWSLREYYDFLTARRRSRIRRVPGPPGRYALEVRQRPLALVLPGNTAPGGLRLDGRPVAAAARRRIRLDGAPAWLLALSPGDHRLDLRGGRQ